MYQTKSTILNLSKQEYLILKQISHASKDLYNSALYEIRQHFFNTCKYLNYFEVAKILKDSKQYKSLPSDPAQQTLKDVDQNFKSFFALIKAKREGKYNEKVNIPGYLEKHQHFQLTYPIRQTQQNSKSFRINVPRNLQDKYNLKSITIQKPEYIKQHTLKEVRLCPKHNCKYFTIEWIYQVKEINHNLDKDRVISLDPGLDNFMTILDNTSGDPIILDGKYIKSLNRFYNKELSSKKPKSKNKIRLLNNRKNKLNECLNQYANFIIQYCLKHKVGTIVIGKGYESSKNINLGKKTNQNFCFIPYSKFISKLQSKCQLNEIQIKLQEESYTSKCDHLAGQQMKHQDNYLGKRVKRGLFKSSTGRLINADVNGSLGILLKSKHKIDLVQLVNSGRINRPRRVMLQEIVKNSSINVLKELESVSLKHNVKIVND